MRTCPHCQVKVREENFGAHLARVHGVREQVRRNRTLGTAYLAGGAVVAIVLVLGLVFYLQGGPPALAPVAPGSGVAGAVGTRVGNTAPEFQVADISGRKVTRITLAAEKPGLIFFTATWCLPCIEGLRQLVKFQQDVGGDPFNVLVMFVDPRETNDDLRAYRDRWRFPTRWFYALDRDDMIFRYGIRYLDTKFVLDQNGIVRFADIYPANYETWRRALSTVGIVPRSP